jgi:hypothetical protein
MTARNKQFISTSKASLNTTLCYCEHIQVLFFVLANEVLVTGIRLFRYYKYVYGIRKIRVISVKMMLPLLRSNIMTCN